MISVFLRIRVLFALCVCMKDRSNPAGFAMQENMDGEKNSNAR